MESIRERRLRIEAELIATKEYNKKFNKLKAKIRSDMTNSSYLSVVYKLEHIKSHPDMIVNDDINHPETIRAYTEVIDHYLGG